MHTILHCQKPNLCLVSCALVVVAHYLWVSLSAWRSVCPWHHREEEFLQKKKNIKSGSAAPRDSRTKNTRRYEERWVKGASCFSWKQQPFSFNELQITSSERFRWLKPLVSDCLWFFQLKRKKWAETKHHCGITPRSRFDNFLLPTLSGYCGPSRDLPCTSLKQFLGGGVGV